MSSFIFTTLQPGMYHGHNKKPPYFEGWYFKLVSRDETQRVAVIPGIILGQKAHAFIQVLNGVSGHSTYHTYPVEEFWASQENFDVRIGGSRFTVNQVTLDIRDNLGTVSGEVAFHGGTPWPVSLLSPGIMGWYAWVPRMECYHGVLSFDHHIEGAMEIDGETFAFTGGRGYIEKDWGQAFPAAWVWFQSNHFAVPGTCLTASVAIIPWLHSAFRGFIVGLWHQGQLYCFATYNGARIESLAIGEHHIDWVLRNKEYRLEMHAHQAPGGLLLGPTKVEMGKRVDETLSATVEVHLSHLSGETVFDGQGKYAGLEVNGEIERLSSQGG